MKLVLAPTVAVILSTGFLVLPVLSQQPLGGYHLLKKVPLTGAAAAPDREWFDYITVDAAAGRVYLAHGAEVAVVDTGNGSWIGSIPGLNLAHGTLLLSQLKRGVISDGGADKVVVFDSTSLKK